MKPHKLDQVVDGLGLARSRGEELPLGNKVDPLDELIYIILTTMTQYGVEGGL